MFPEAEASPQRPVPLTDPAAPSPRVGSLPHPVAQQAGDGATPPFGPGHAFYDRAAYHAWAWSHLRTALFWTGATACLLNGAAWLLLSYAFGAPQ